MVPGQYLGGSSHLCYVYIIYITCIIRPSIAGEERRTGAAAQAESALDGRAAAALTVTLRRGVAESVTVMVFVSSASGPRVSVHPRSAILWAAPRTRLMGVLY